MSEAKKFVPLSELDSPKVRFVAPVPPFVDQDRLGINLGRIELLLRIGGIRHLRVEGQTGEATSSFVPTIAGFDSQGSAYSAQIGTKLSIPTYSTDVQDGGSSDLLGSRWADGVVNINVDETTKRIMGNKKWEDGVRDPKAWSHYLNESIKNGIVDNGTRHLIQGARPLDYIFGAIGWLSVYGYSVLGSHSLSANYIGAYLALNIIIPKLIRNTSSEGHRQSLLLSGPQFDRALALKLISSGSTLVKGISDSRT